MNRRTLLGALVLLAMLTPAAARAQWPADSTQFVRLTPGGDSYFTLYGACPDGLGGAFVCWSSKVSTPLGLLYLQRVDADGFPAFADGARILGDDEDYRALAADDAGHAVILTSTFVADSGQVLWLSCYGAQGEERWRTRLWSGVTSSGWPTNHLRYVASAGAWVVTWNDGSASPARLRAQAVGVDGMLRWGEEGRVAATQTGEMSMGPAADDGEGGVWLAFRSTPPDYVRYTTWLQHVDRTGTPRWNPGGLLLRADGSPVFSLASSPDGSAWLTLQRFSWWPGDASDPVQRVLADGTFAFGPDGLPLPGNPAERRGSAVIALVAPDRAWLLWTRRSEDGLGWVTEAQRLDADGAWLGTGPVLLGTQGIWTEYLGLRAYVNPGGGVSVTISPNADRSAPVQRLDADGVPLWPAGTTLLQLPPGMVTWGGETLPDGTGGLITVQTIMGSGLDGNDAPPFVCLQHVDAWGRHGDLPSLAVDATLPEDFALATPAPSPMLASTSVRFRLATAGDAALELFDVGGRRVRTLAHDRFEAGGHAVTLTRDGDGARLTPGLYWLRLTAPGGTRTTRLVVLD